MTNTEETANKIKVGTIRIENGQLIGLGICEKESINIEALNKLFDWMGKCGVVESISDAISAIAKLQAEASFYDESDNDELKKFIVDDLRPTLGDINIFNLNMILKTFIK